MKKILLIIPLLILLIMGRFILDKQIDYDVSTEGVSIPEFTEVEIDFDQRLDHNISLPFMASAVIDINNDGVEELLLGGGPNQLDAVFEYKNGQFLPIHDGLNLTKEDILDATFAASVVDIDNNGFSDLILTRTTGIWLYKNNGGHFSGEKLTLPLNNNTTPLSVAIADLNRDGHFDLYVSGYIKKELVEGQNIFNKEGYGGTSALFLNNGDNTFTDITKSSGLLYTHNTFMAVFVDVDNDGLEDLIVAHDTGHVKTWKNLGDNTFQDMPNPNSVEYSYPMGIAVTDYGNNNSVDFFFSNVGTTPPGFIVKGDLREDQVFNPDWIMFENKGGFKFEDIASKTKLAKYEFSWGAIFEDFNLDGLDDLVVSENYIGFPPHKLPMLRLPGRFFIQNHSGEFAETGRTSKVFNNDFSISPITADFNHDGYPDLVHVNLNGRSRAFISKGGKANYLKVVLPKTIESIAAKIQVKRSDGKTIYRDYVSGEGLCSDQSHIQIFGLGNAQASEITVNYINGDEFNIQGNFANQTISF